MATKKQSDSVEALVLRDCAFGQCGEVVTLTDAEAEIGVEHGMLDASSAAIKAAKAA